MAVAGALAGLAGGIEILGVQYRLIEGFSNGFGFNAVAVALLAALDPLAVIPAGLFFGFVEAGALAMQREIGVPSSLVYVIQGLTMVFVLCAMGFDKRARRV
jgi:simple sugar transport system permease protein